jgi:hypothetical protein
MQQSALSMYKQVELKSLTVNQITEKFFKTILLDIEDANECTSDKDKVFFLSHATQLVFILLEHINTELPEVELNSYINILLKIGDELKNSIKTKKPVKSGVIDTINYLIDINRIPYKE